MLSECALATRTCGTAGKQPEQLETSGGRDAQLARLADAAARVGKMLRLQLCSSAGHDAQLDRCSKIGWGRLASGRCTRTPSQ